MIAPAGHLAEQRHVWPWEAEPYRLWSLLDMQRILGGLWIILIRDLEWAHHSLIMSPDSSVEELGKVVDGIVEEAVKIPLRGPFMLQAKRLKKYIDGGMRGDRLALLASELREQLIAEFADYLFFVVPPERKWVYLDPEKWFGPAVAAKFPDTRRDIRDACQCFSLGQWTATVFHSMRVLERGLRDLAARVNTTPSAPIELENWKNIIDQIEKAIRAKEGVTKSAQKSEDLEFYSTAAVEFRYFKDAWRNHVAHSRSDYDEQDSMRVLSHVRDFMNHLTTR